MPAIWLRGITNIFSMTGEIYATEKLTELILNNHTDISIQFGSCRAFSDLKFAYCGPNQLMTFQSCNLSPNQLLAGSVV